MQLLMPLMLTLCCWKVCHSGSPHPEVQLGRTVITGLRSAVGHNKHVRKFLGIRYGQAPTGPRRFKLPERAELPERVSAQRYGARCPQGPAFTPDTSEDCLFLNVFVPETSASDEHLMMPVLVWIHGGGFIVGTADVYEAEELAGGGGIIVVTLNYRLGALGFLSTGDASSRGNYGLWDQRLALRWIQDHIVHFGGDKDLVTVAGVSAGAASASFHAMSPLSRDLFRHVILLSGSATAPWARVSSADAVEAAQALGQRLGCQPDQQSRSASTLSLVSCLREQSVDDILQHSYVVFPPKVGFSLVDFAWGPVEDGSLIVVDIDTATPFAGPLLAGLVNNEGDTLISWTVPRVSQAIPDVEVLLKDRQFFEQQFLPTLLKQTYPGMVSLPWPTRHRQEKKEEKEGVFQQSPYLEALRRLQCAYGQGGSAEIYEELREVYGDQGFLLGTVRFLETVCRKEPQPPCFFYFAGYQTKRPGIVGLRHLDDLVFLFGFNITLSREWLGFEGHVTDLDLQLARDMRRLFVNFIKTGDPNSPETPRGWPRWRPYTSKGTNYLHVSPSPAVLSHLKADKMALWLKEIPRILSSRDNVTDDEWQCPQSASSAYVVLFSASKNIGLILLVLLLYLFAEVDVGGFEVG